MRKWYYAVIAVTVGVICLWLGWTFYSRSRDNQAMIRQIEDEKNARRQAVVDAYGDSLEIKGFSAPGMIRKGETVQVCYSVTGAETVRIEPYIDETWPSFQRCMDVSPQKDTTYTITVEDKDGNQKTASLTIKVD